MEPPPTNVPPTGSLHWERLAPDDGAEADAVDESQALAGRHRVRTLVQLRRPLPLPADLLAVHPPAATRAFRPGEDDDAFLEVNNAAFDWHPDQGGWDRARLAEELAAPWVDLAGFLVHDDPGRPGRLDGFCWTRVHPAASDEPALGEISAIGTDPRRHGTGLGTAMVVAGLVHLGDEGLGVAILYSEEANVAARRTYARLGFETHERRGGYR